MKTILYIILSLFIIACKGQEKEYLDFKLPVSPVVDTIKVENKKIIFTLTEFLKTKNESIISNEYWLESDFEKFQYPFADIYNIENGNKSKNYYKPTLMELIEIDSTQKLLKIGFVGHNKETDESIIRAIYNLIAVKSNNGKWYLRQAIEHITHNWIVQNENSITYLFPPEKSINQNEIKKQANDIKNICTFFNCEPIKITYYSCLNPKQVFEVKGFDYLPNMYFSQTGGMADFGDIVYSGNNSEFYTHEIVHVYTKKLYPKINRLLDEGLATYIGGSGLHDYEWHRAKMARYLKNAKINLGEHLMPYERLYIDGETPIPYMIGALICERTIRIYGKKKLFELFKSGNDIVNILEEIGLTKENLTNEITEELKLTTTPYMQ